MKILIVIVSIIVGVYLAYSIYPTETFSQSTINPDTTIKVTADVTTNLIPDQVVITITIKSKPDKSSLVLDDQDENIAKTIQLLENIDINSTIIIGSRNIYYIHPLLQIM